MIKAARGDKPLAPAVPWFEALLEHLGAGKMVHAFEDRESDLAKRLLGETQFLTDKPFIYCAMSMRLD